ncbi:MAG: methionine adenosyltransferase [Coriobacteriia bacterium]|nr:methionine adenosyltransferase [Coriobacteriia bacterium]
MKSTSYLHTSESVTEGHPDKICDQISDAVLDELLIREAQLEKQGFSDENGEARLDSVRCAVETLVSTGLVMLTGEVRTQGYVDMPVIARNVIRDIGYTRAKYGFDADTCSVLNTVHEQSPDIAMGVDRDDAEDKYDKVGAGDQGIIFGYACNETSTLMPMPIHLAHRLSERLTEVRKTEKLPYLRPDGKTQVSVRYVDGKPQSVETVVISSQHSEKVSDTQLRKDILANVIKPTFEKWEIPLQDDADIFINPTGRFVIGGPQGDSGLTGRKIIVDTYGGSGHHGGGAFSGKDPTKVDRSAAYMARYVAKNIVDAGLADKCELQISYAIGVAKPTSLRINTFGTGKVTDDEILTKVDKVFDLRPAAIQESLDLWRPIYRLTSNYGHFGRELPEFTWEMTDKASELSH